MAARWLRAFVLLGTVMLFATAAQAERRVALVIGNSAYKNVSRLPNPGNDAAAVAKLLSDSGFDVVESKRDLSIADMRRAVRDFSNTARDADISVIYYAGHGIEVDGVNYLIPTDAALEADVDVEDETISLDRFLRAVEPTKRLRLVILDACRDNPFAKTMKRSVGSRAVSRGLAKVEPQASDTLIAFAAKAGSTASDGDGGNSPFAKAIIRNIAVPGLDLRLAFGRVRDEVLKATNQKQEPFVYGSLGGSELALVPSKAVASPEPVVAAPAVQPAPAADPEASARRDYEFVERIGTVQAWDAFISIYGKGMYAELAKAQRAKVAAADAIKAAEAEKAAKAESAKAAAAAAKALEEAKAAEARANKQLEQAKAADAERLARETAQKSEQKVAALEQPAPAAPPSTVSGPAPGELARSLQTELRRVGCFANSSDGEWNAPTRKALESFNRFSGLKLDTKSASLDAVEAVKQRTGRICPLECGKGFKADGERCVAATCPAGTEMDGDGDCVKPAAKSAARPASEKKPAPPAVAPAPAKTASSGQQQIICGQGGCRQVKAGCSISHSTSHNRTLYAEVCK